MINIPVRDLNEENFYSRSLQTIEDVCEMYGLEKEFGILSMANQVVSDFISQCAENSTLDMSVHVDSESVAFIYCSFSPIFESLIEFDNDNQNLLDILSDKTEYNSDNKSFTIMFHVKPNMQNHYIHRPISKLITEKLSV